MPRLKTSVGHHMNNTLELLSILFFFSFSVATHSFPSIVEAVETVPRKKFMLAVYELNRIDFSDEERRMPCATAIALSDSNISASIVILY